MGYSPVISFCQGGDKFRVEVSAIISVVKLFRLTELRECFLSPDNAQTRSFTTESTEVFLKVFLRDLCGLGGEKALKKQSLRRYF